MLFLRKQSILLGYGLKKNLGYIIKLLTQNILTYSNAQDTFFSKLAYISLENTGSYSGILVLGQMD